MSRTLLGALLASNRSAHLDENSCDWEAVTDLAIRERVAPLLARTLKGDARVPEAVHRRLRAELYNTAAFNQLLYRELSSLLERAAFEPAPVLLKGAALATTVYDDPALRPMCDLDLLVRREDLGRWIAHLEALGYTRATPEMGAGLSDGVHYQLAFRNVSHDGVIELHWSLVAGVSDWRAPDMEWFWSETEPWGGTAGLARKLSPLANLLYLSAHAMLQHGGASATLLWLYDIHRVIDRAGDGIRWAEVVERARAFEWDAAVAEALGRVRALFGTSVPETTIAELGEGPTTRASAHVEAKADVHASRAELVWRELSCLSAAGRWRLVLAILFPRPAYVKWRYPGVRGLWPFAYLYRWGVVVWEGVFALLRRQRDSRTAAC